MHICILHGIIIHMMTVGLFYKKKYFENTDYLDAVAGTLKARNLDCRLVQDSSQLDGLDVLIVFGGDGTILMVASECARRGIKILGINYGHIGFLAEFEPEKLDFAIELLCSGNFRTQKRSLLKINYCDKIYYALNDLVIQRCTSGNAFSNTVNLEAAIDGSVVDNYTADGLIVSSPTGSTAYSLAAGGSILTPDINAFIMTPICAHSLHSRPVVYSDKSLLTIKRLDDRGALNIIVDGVAEDCLFGDGKIQISRAEFDVEFITSPDRNFFNKLLLKLNKWST